MTRLSKIGRQIHELIDMINVSAERTEVFVEVCENLEKAIGFNGAVLVPHESTNAAALLKTGHLILNESTTSSLAFADHYARLDPFFTGWMLNPANLNKAARNTDVVPVTQFKDSEFYQDFLRHVPALYVLGGLLAHNGKILGGFALHRTPADHDFSERDVLVLNCVLPPLARTLSLLEAPPPSSLAEHADPDKILHTLDLTQREEQILRFVLAGWRYREIAERLNVHVQTVKKHMREIQSKAHVRNHHELFTRLAGIRWVKEQPGMTAESATTILSDRFQ